MEQVYHYIWVILVLLLASELHPYISYEYMQEPEQLVIYKVQFKLLHH